MASSWFLKADASHRVQSHLIIGCVLQVTVDTTATSHFFRDSQSNNFSYLDPIQKVKQGGGKGAKAFIPIKWLQS